MLPKKVKKEVRPCVNCKESHLIYDRNKWLCKECTNKARRARTGNLLLLFVEIWDERPHFCEECGKWLGNEPKSHFFSHIKSRGAHPELKMEKSNIELLCYECHQQHEFGGI